MLRIRPERRAGSFRRFPASPFWGGAFPQKGGIVALLAAASLVAGGCSRRPREERPPDVLIVVADTLRADRLGTYGYQEQTSPRLDRFARSAVVFENAISPAPLTMPAMAALMTGLYPDRTGVINHTPGDRLSKAVRTLAEIARDAGYATAAVVSNPWLAKKPMGFARGFERYVNRVTPRGRRPTAAEVTRAAVRLLRRRDGRPLLLWAHYIDTHMPYRPPPRLARRFGHRVVTTPIIEEFRRRGSDRQRIYFDPPFAKADIEATAGLYDAAVRYVDSRAGRLLKAWRRRVDPARSIVIVTADHGESLGEHDLYFAHDFTLYEELLHVPLIVRMPGAAPGRSSKLVSLIDIVPTLCQAMGVECPPALDGRPLLPAASGDDSRVVFAASVPMRQRYARCPWLTVPGPAGRWTMARSSVAKLIRIPEPLDTRWLLFDLTRDPLETSPLDEPRPDLEQALERWRRSLPKLHGRASAPVTLGAQTRKALDALGYIN